MKTARQAIEQEPQVRSLIDWAPENIRAAQIMADSGYLALAADLCESFIADERIFSCLNTRALGLQGLPLTFEADGGKKRAIKALEAEEDYWKMFPAADLAMMHIWGILLGVCPVQLIWQKGPKGRLLTKIKVWSPRHLRQDQETKQWFLRVGSGSREIEICKNGKPDGKWALFMPYGSNRPWARSIWRALANWYLLKRYAIQDWGYYSEKNGQGILVAEGSEASTKTARQEATNDLNALGRDSAIALPPGWNLKLLEATANTWETFQAQKDAADTGTAVCILGQNMSTEVPKGAETGMTLHKYVFQFYINADAESVPTFLHDNILVFWAQWNFGRADLAPWPKYDATPPEDKNARATRIAQIGEGFHRLFESGAPIDFLKLAEMYGLPVLDAKAIADKTASDKAAGEKTVPSTDLPADQSAPNADQGNAPQDVPKPDVSALPAA